MKNGVREQKHWAGEYPQLGTALPATEPLCFEIAQSRNYAAISIK